MKNQLKLNDGQVTYEFSDEEMYQDKSYMHFKKTSKWKKDGKDNVKYQRITVSPKDWEAFRGFLDEVLEATRPEPGTEDEQDAPI